MLLYNPKRNPEQKLVIKTKTEFGYSGYDNGMPNFLAIDYIDRDHRPHWERYGSGTAHVDMVYNKAHGTLRLIVSEVGAGKQTGKEAWATLPKEVVEALRDMLVKGDL